jgi:hypothetical protein
MESLSFDNSAFVHRPTLFSALLGKEKLLFGSSCLLSWSPLESCPWICLSLFLSEIAFLYLSFLLFLIVYTIKGLHIDILG